MTTDVDDKHCFHCGLPLPEDEAFTVTIRGKDEKMCCHGCEAVAQAIVDGGLETFYDHRTETARKADALIPEELQRFDLYDENRLIARAQRLPPAFLIPLHRLDR